MNNSTGSPISLNGRQHDDRRAVNAPNRLVAIPDLVYPQVRWNDDDYARLEARLDLYTDFVVLSKFFAGEVSEKYVVDPAEVAAALAGIDLGSGLLPENCLFWSKRDGWDRLGIYLPPRTWLVTVRNEAQAWPGPSMPCSMTCGVCSSSQTACCRHSTYLACWLRITNLFSSFSSGNATALIWP